MAKKELNEDLLAGGSLSAEDKNAGKEAKKQAKAEKVKAKNDAKRAKIKAELDELKAKKAGETDEKKIEELNASIKKLSDKYSAVGSTTGLGISKNTAKIIQSVVCVVIVIALLAAYVCTGAVRKGFISYTGLPAKAFTAVTVTNGTQKANVKVETYNFYFATTYNSISSQQSTYEQYGLDLSQVGLDVNLDEPLAKQDYTDKDNKTITWAEHLHNMVIESIENTYTFYLAAVEANGGKDPEITDEQKEELDELLKNYEEQANKYGFTLSGYLVAAMGKGVTEKVLTREVTRQYIAENYQNSLTSDVEAKNYTADDIKKYKDENLDSLKTVDIRLFECSSEDDAKAFKKALKADGSNFADLCVKYSSEAYEKVAYEEDGYSTMLGVNKAVLQNGGYAIGTADEHDHEGEEEGHEHTYAGLDWLFDKSRKAGDSYQEGTSVVYVLAPASLSKRTTVNVRHILIKPLADSDDQSAATDKDWTAAFDSAKSILNEWKSGDKTDASFAELAKKNSQDTGSAENGGLYENVVTGQMVNPFSTWCFDNSRKAGDTAIVRSQFGYHVMYFVKANDEKIWEYNAKQALSSSDGSSQIEKLKEDYTAKVNWFGSRYFEKDTDISN